MKIRHAYQSCFLGCISFVFGTMVELAFVCYITRCQAGNKKDPQFRAPYQSISSSSSSVAGGTMNNSMAAPAFGCLAGTRESNLNSLRYRPHTYANGVCGNGRGAMESNRALLVSHEGRHRRASHGNNGTAHLRQSPSPPPTSRLIRNGSPPSSTTNIEMNTMFTPAGPLTFEQVSIYNYCYTSLQILPHLPYFT